MIPRTMAAMCLMGHGGLDQLIYQQDMPVPQPQQDEVLIKVTATAKNNTDRKAREGLYPVDKTDHMTSFQIGGSPTLTFPRIQGADVVGRIVAVGRNVAETRLGERGLLDFNLYPSSDDSINLIPDYYGHGAEGGYAEYMAAKADQFYRIDNAELADAELAALGMCSYQTAFHMLTVAKVKAGERVLVSGASGGVGTALIQLCRLLGAIPYAVSQQSKTAALTALGAEAVLDRGDLTDFVERTLTVTGGAPIDAVMDLVGGDMTDHFIDTMIQDMRARTTYPRLSIAGASAGNFSRIMWTRIYLYQVQIMGVSHGTRQEVRQLIAWIRSGQLKPVLQGTFKLSQLHQAEEYFVNRHPNHLGKVVIVPDSQWAEHGAAFAITASSA